MTTSSTDRAELLLDLARRVTATLDLQRVLDQTFAALHQLVEFSGGAIQLVEEDALVAAALEPPGPPEAYAVRIPFGKGVSGQIAADGRATYIADITIDARVHPDGRARGVSSGVRTYFGVPLILHGEPTGVLQIDAVGVDAFSSDDRAVVLAFAPTVAAAVQNARLFQREQLARRELQDIQRMKDEFLALVSHELRTPITVVLGFAETIAHQAPELSTDTISLFADRIAHGSRRLAQLLDDLLDVAHIRAGELIVRMGPVSVDEAVHDAVAAFVDVDHPANVQLPPGLAKVWTDPARLRQVLGHLLSNACKFSAPGSRIDVTGEQHDDRVSVTIADRGTGLPADLERAFQSFSQGESFETRQSGGLGVGLYLVKQLCELLDADLDVRSGPEEGTRVTIKLTVA